MPSDRSPLDAESALLAYVLLLVGMYAIGAPAQASGVVYGLWLTELVAIALPAIFRISLAGVRIGPYLGLRRLTWKQALIAAVGHDRFGSRPARPAKVQPQLLPAP